MDLKTKLIHQPRTSITADNHPVTEPLYDSVKYTFSEFSALEELLDGKRRGFLYSRVTNPTMARLQKLLADLQGTEEALITNNGLSAITTALFSLLSAGDHVVLFYESYKPTRYVIRNLLKRFGVSHTILSVLDLDEIEKTFVEKRPRICIFESPSNPLLRIPDVARICELAKRHDVLTILDNTLAGFESHHHLPIDLYIHSLTKYVSGHGDAMGGAILGSESLLHSMFGDYIHLATAIDPTTAHHLLQEVKTYSVRRERQCASALEIATFLSSHPKIEQVLYPGLPSHPDHDRAKKYLRDFGTVICLQLKGADSGLQQFIDRLKLFHCTSSVGSVDSLIAPALLFFGTDLTEHEREKIGLFGTTARLSIGLEDSKDLIDDLKGALEHV